MKMKTPSEFVASLHARRERTLQPVIYSYTNPIDRLQQSHLQIEILIK